MIATALSPGVMRKGHYKYGDRGSAVVKVLSYKSEGRWFDSNGVIEFFINIIPLIAVLPWVRLSL
jgi:hypothetical protein